MDNRNTPVLAGNKTDELRYTFLYGLLSILSNLPISRESFLHDPANIRNRKKPILFTNIRPRTLLAALMTSSAGTRRSISHLRQNPILKNETGNNMVNPREEETTKAMKSSRKRKVEKNSEGKMEDG